MTYQSIDLGTTAGDGTGDTIRAGGDKLNDNFVELYTLLGTGTALTSGISATATVVTLAGPVITGVAEFQDGGVSAPSITNSGDTNTGIYFSAQDALSITTGAALRGTFNSTGLAVVGNVTTTGTVEPAGDTDSGDNAAIGYTSAEGLILTGQGSTNDITIKNDADADVLEIPTGTTNVTVVGDITSAKTLNASGDTAAGDNAAIGYTSTEGLILTGQGSTNDITIKNDADADVIEIPTGTVNVTMAGTLGVVGAVTTAALTASGIIKTDDATEATSTTDGSLQTDGGLSVVKDSVFGDDVKLLSDAAVLGFGADGDVTLTHVADTGLLLNAAMEIQFRDSAISIGSTADGDLSIAADDEIDITSTLIDINGNLDVSGTLTQTGVATFAARPVFSSNITVQDGGQIGSASDADAIAIASNGVVTFSQAPVFPDGSIDIADIDLDGATEMAAAVVDADLFMIDDGAGGTMKSMLASRLKTYIVASVGAAADNITGGDAAINLTTSSGNITIDAAANDSDIILKGTDGGVDTTFLTIDGSAAGLSTFGAGITIGGNLIIPDAGNIGSASDTDAIAIASDGVVTFSQIPVMPANSIDSDEYIDGSIDLAHMSANSVDSDQYVDGSIDTAHIADNQITLAKMAGIARGKIIYGDASGDPAVLTIGSANTILTSDGTDFSWAAAASNAADDIDAGDAAILLTTSSGNITIDAAANDSDIILKGTDGGSDTTFLTIDGSAAGEATFNAGIVIANAGNIGSASDKDAIAIASNGVVTFSQIPVLPANSIDSDYYVDGSIDTAHIADSQITSAKIANGTIVAADLASDSITNAKIADNAIDSEHYTDGSIDVAHMSANSIDSAQYVDGSIDRAHLSADIIDGTKIANDVINSEHYAAGSIDREHLAADIVDGTKIADDAINSEHIAADSIDAEHYAAGSVDATAIAASAVGASELDVSGNGTTLQFLRSDGDGTMTWAAPGIISVQDFSSSGTWSRPSGCTKVLVHVVGGGGGAKNGTADDKAADTIRGSGGDGGSAEEVIDVSSTASVTVTVGAGGGDSATGGTSSFGSFCSATGGAGGPSFQHQVGSNGSGSGGQINRSGNTYGPSFGSGGIATNGASSGKGGYAYVVNYG